jgi:hypothetical protein
MIARARAAAAAAAAAWCVLESGGISHFDTSHMWTLESFRHAATSLPSIDIPAEFISSLVLPTV